MGRQQKRSGAERRRRSRTVKNLEATRPFWMPDLESEARRLEISLARKFQGAALTVRVERGHLVVYDSGSHWTGVALPPRRQLRLTPINTAVYRLSYLRHTGRWWPLANTGRTEKLASTVASHLEPFLEMR